MQSIYDSSTVSSFYQRIEKLSATTPSQWGKMDVAQMLAHCSIPLEGAVSDAPIRKTLMAMVFGRVAKPAATNEVPFKKNLPTARDFVVSAPSNFEQEKQRLKKAIARFSETGAAAMDNRPHPFFGKLTATEWSNLMVKHLDHHLRQFGA